MRIAFFIAGVALIYGSGCFSMRTDEVAAAPRAALITGLFGLGCTLLAAFVG